MARKAEATLWMLVKIGKRSVMKRVLKKGRSYVPKVELSIRTWLARAGERRDSECASDGQEVWSTNEGPGPGPNSTNEGGGPKPAADRRKIGGRLRNGSRKAQER